MTYTVDPDIACAATLDPAFYTDEAAYAAVRERVFARTWQWLGDLDRRRATRDAVAARPAARHPRRAAAAGARRRRDAALPVERLHAPREPPGRRAVPRRPDPLRLPLAALRPLGAHDVHARVRGRAGLSVGRRRPAAGAVRDVGRPGLRRARIRRRRSPRSRPTCARGPHGCRWSNSGTTRRATATTRSTRTGRSTSRTTSKASTSRSCTPD